MDKPSPLFRIKKQGYLYLLVPTLLTFILYIPGLSGPFLLDDYSNQINRYSAGFDWEHILSVSFGYHSGPLGRPLAYFTFILNAIADKGAWGYKLVNIILHLVTGALLFVLFQRLIRIRNLPDAPQKIYLTAAVSLAIWLLHPFQVSTVLYVVQRMSILSALFVTAALLCYLRFREANHQNRQASALAHGACYTVFGVLAMASKESAALLPLFALAIEFSVFRLKPPSEKKSRNSFYLFTILFIGIPVLLGIFYAATHIDGIISGYASRDFSFEERLYTEVHALIFYLRMIISPDLSLMSIYHDDFPIQHSLDPLILFYLALFVIAIIAAFFFRRKYPLASLGILWFFISHLLESTFIALELVFEHRNYLAIAGLSLISAEIIGYSLSNKVKKSVRTALLAGVTLFCTFLIFLTALRVDTWSTHEKLFLTLEQYHPNSPRILMELINIDIQKKQYHLAKRKIERIARLRTKSAEADIMHLIIDCQKGIPSETNLRTARNKLQGKSSDIGPATELLKNLGMLSANRNCNSYSTEQILSLIQTALKHPSIIRSGKKRLLLYMTVGRLYAETGQIEKAARNYLRAYKAQPGELDPLLSKAYLELNSGLLDEAEQTAKLLRKREGNTIRHYRHLINELEDYITHARNNK